MSINNKYKRNCPICKFEIVYSNKYTLQNATKSNTYCNKCTEHYKRKQETIWSRLNVNEIQQMYINDKKSIKTISIMLGVSYKVIRKCLINNNIPMRKTNMIGLRKLSKETKSKIKDSKLGSKNPNFGKPILPHVLDALQKSRPKHASKETREKLSATRIQRGLAKGDKNPMKNPKNLLKWIKSNNISPNKKETLLFNILSNNFPNMFLLNVTGEILILNGKIPDFVNIKDKKIIEFYGDYWHKGEDENVRINEFKALGYNTLIIWEKELTNIESVIEKIRLFVG